MSDSSVPPSPLLSPSLGSLAPEDDTGSPVEAHQVTPRAESRSRRSPRPIASGHFSDADSPISRSARAAQAALPRDSPTTARLAAHLQPPADSQHSQDSQCEVPSSQTASQMVHSGDEGASLRFDQPSLCSSTLRSAQSFVDPPPSFRVISREPTPMQPKTLFSDVDSDEMNSSPLSSTAYSTMEDTRDAPFLAPGAALAQETDFSFADEAHVLLVDGSSSATAKQQKKRSRRRSMARASSSSSSSSSCSSDACSSSTCDSTPSGSSSSSTCGSSSCASSAGSASETSEHSLSSSSESSRRRSGRQQSKRRSLQEPCSARVGATPLEKRPRLDVEQSTSSLGAFSLDPDQATVEFSESGRFAPVEEAQKENSPVNNATEPIEAPSTLIPVTRTKTKKRSRSTRKHSAAEAGSVASSVGEVSSASSVRPLQSRATRKSGSCTTSTREKARSARAEKAHATSARKQQKRKRRSSTSTSSPSAASASTPDPKRSAGSPASKRASSSKLLGKATPRLRLPKSPPSGSRARIKSLPGVTFTSVSEESLETLSGVVHGLYRAWRQQPPSSGESSVERAKLSVLYPTQELEPWVTHVVIGDKRRTLKVLNAISLGLWVVSSSWILDTLESGAYPAEEGYEVYGWFPGVRRSRRAHESGKPKLLQGKKVFLRGNQTSPPVPDLLALIMQCGGELVSRVSDCDLCIAGQHANRTKPSDIPVVSTAWLLDSISEYKLQPTAKYSFDYGHN